MQITNPTAYTQAVNTAKYHNYQYWVAQRPVISDEEFDALYFEIQQYEAEHPEDILPDSPTRSVGSEAGKHTIPHRIPMLSTQKVKTTEDVIKWMRSTTKAAERNAAELFQIQANREARLFSVEWKYDGTSCSLVYQDGHLIEASTRGDTKAGLGRDILCHLRGTGLSPVPQWLCSPVTEDDVRRGPGLGMFIQGRIEVRGEVVITDDNFNEYLKDVYPDPRTAAASILNTDGSTPYDCYLTFKACSS